MPVIASRPVHQAAMIGLPTPADRPTATAAPDRASSLARTDAYVNSSIQGVENGLVSLFNTYNDTRAAVAAQQGGPEGLTNVIDFGRMGRSMGWAVVRRGVTSGASNGWAYYKGRISGAEAGGRVVGDVSTSVVASAVGSVATNLAVFGLKRAGASGVPVMIGGLVAGWGVNNLTHRVLRHQGFTQAVTTHATDLFARMGDHKAAETQP